MTRFRDREIVRASKVKLDTQNKMKTHEYLKTFATEASAFDWMRFKNQAAKKAGNRKDFLVVVDGPENDFAVVDVNTAIELGGGYKWAV